MRDGAYASQASLNRRLLPRQRKRLVAANLKRVSTISPTLGVNGSVVSGSGEGPKCLCRGDGRIAPAVFLVTGPITSPFRQAYGSNFDWRVRRSLDGRLIRQVTPQSPMLVIKLPISADASQPPILRTSRRFLVANHFRQLLQPKVSTWLRLNTIHQRLWIIKSDLWVPERNGVSNSEHQ